MPKARRWWATYNSLFAQLKRRNSEINSGGRSCRSACNALISEVNAALPRAKELYASGKVKPFDAARQAGEGAGARPVPGASAAAAMESACSAAELRRALVAGDEAFLKGLSGKPVVIEGMVLKPPKTEGDLALAEIMAGGGALPVAFPPDTEAAALRMATKVVVAGEAAEAGGRWLLRASAWGKASDVKAGQPLTRCTWPEPGAGSAD
ncbi:MAG: hypothetical protein ACYS9X_07970 [Planctomycetota bacterium]